MRRLTKFWSGLLWLGVLVVALSVPMGAVMASEHRDIRQAGPGRRRGRARR